MISVITPTIRPEGLEIVNIALQRQTNQDFEWLVGSQFTPNCKLCTHVKDDFEGGVWTLNRIYNKLIKEAKGDLIVSIQDYTFFNHDALSRYEYYFEAGYHIVSGVGDKYSSVYPTLGENLWTDPRRTGKAGVRTVPFNMIEGNFCAISKKALEDVGGFDESLDFEGFGMDWYGLLERLHLLAYEFYIDESIESYSLTHGRPDGWEEKNLIHGGYTKKAVQYSKQPRLKYL